jgi:predicted nucleic acid-binding protein
MDSVYFADSFYWIALAHPRDAFHARVLAWEQAHPGAGLVTTEEVLTEVLNWFATRGPAGRTLAIQLTRDVLGDSLTQVLPQTTGGFASALALYEARLDKEYSLVDCRSMVAMRTLGISEVLTNDHHFTQEGFTILFP